MSSLFFYVGQTVYEISNGFRDIAIFLNHVLQICTMFGSKTSKGARSSTFSQKKYLEK